MDQMTPAAEKSPDRIIDITIDSKSLGRVSSNIEHEREVAIFDILDGNSFAVEGLHSGPFKLHLATAEDRLILSLATEQGENVGQHALSLTPLKRIMKDYFMVCETYYAAVRTAPPAKIQAIDVNRRALHDEGSNVLKEKLLPKIAVDADTARRLFTLVCALHWKG